MDGDEADGYDEVIYPVDFEEAGHIVDDVSRCHFDLLLCTHISTDHARHYGQTLAARLSFDCDL